MTAMNPDNILRQTIEAVRPVGHYIRAQRGQLSEADITDKSRNNLVSFVDREAEKKLVRALREIVPSAGFLTEEKTITTEDRALRWVVDPLDGTTNYVYGLPIYAVSVALVNGKDKLIGVIYVPEWDELFYAARGQGAFLNGKPIRVSDRCDLAQALAATGFPYYEFRHEACYMRMFEHYMHTTRGIRRLGAAAVDLAYVACGRFDFYFEFDLHPWDVAAGLLLVEEAGGKTSNFDGSGDALSGEEILASNGLLHDQLLSPI